MQKCLLIIFLLFISDFSLAAFECQKRQGHAEEEQMLIIDQELANTLETLEDWYWSENLGLQPNDTYELDYAEKCLLFLQETKKEDVYCACKFI